MSDIPDPAKTPQEQEELFVVELDDRLEFGVAMIDETELTLGNDHCNNTSWCSGSNPSCTNGSNCS